MSTTKYLAFSNIAQEYVTGPPKTLVVAADNQSRVEIAVAIRAALKDAGALGPNVLSGANTRTALP